MTPVIVPLWKVFILFFILNSASTWAKSSSWQQYVRAPPNSIVYPTSVIAKYTTGNVTNAEGLLSIGQGITTFTRPAPPAPPPWPEGTIANASSYHPGNTYNGHARTYVPSNAIDADVNTFWNDDTNGKYPDILTLVTPELVALDGITILSCIDGFPLDLTVEILQVNSSWSLVANITDNAAVQILVPFPQSVNTTGVRITVTRNQASRQGEFTRIIEVWPVLVPRSGPPSVVVDFGQPVVGFLSISFAGASSNNTGIRLAFSESMEYLTDVSDFSRSYNVSGLPFIYGSNQ